MAQHDGRIMLNMKTHVGLQKAECPGQQSADSMCLVAEGKEAASAVLAMPADQAQGSLPTADQPRPKHLKGKATPWGKETGGGGGVDERGLALATKKKSQKNFAFGPWHQTEALSKSGKGSDVTATSGLLTCKAQTPW